MEASGGVWGASGWRIWRPRSFQEFPKTPPNLPQDDPKSSQRRPQRPPRRSWSQVAIGSWFRSHFWSFLGPLGTPKIMLSLWRGAIFANCASRAREPEIAPNGPKIEPKTTPGGPRMARNVAPNRCSNFDQISTPILTILELQNGTPNHSKISLRAQGPPRDRPEASREPFGRYFGLILASILGPPGAHVRAFSGCTFASFGLLLVYCWCSFSIASSPPLLAF